LPSCCCPAFAWPSSASPRKACGKVSSRVGRSIQAAAIADNTANAAPTPVRGVNGERCECM
jgi:hypothetical protein